MDRINMWHRANEARRLKFIVQDDDERHLLNTKEIQLRKENKQIWDELEYYAKNKEILGKHKRFEFENLLTKYAAKNNSELVKMLNNLRIYRLKQNQRLKNLTDNIQISKCLAYLEKYNTQEKAIKTLLKLN
jgi:hypothetical protein